MSTADIEAHFPQTLSYSKSWMDPPPSIAVLFPFQLCIGIEISDAPPGLEGLPSYLFDACIAAGGALCPSYEYIAGTQRYISASMPVSLSDSAGAHEASSYAR
eukprot:1923370-Rhodomonas_salina.2